MAQFFCERDDHAIALMSASCPYQKIVVADDLFWGGGIVSVLMRIPYVTTSLDTSHVENLYNTSTDV